MQALQKLSRSEETVKRMNVSPAQSDRIPQQPKSQDRDTIPRDREIESIKRTLYNAIDKLEKIQRRDAELITT